MRDDLPGEPLGVRVHLRERIRAGERLVGTVLTFGDPGLAELASAPFDFVWIDLEHSTISERDLIPMAIAASANGCAPLVRLTSPGSERLGAVIDAGVAGVVAPRLDTAEEAAGLVRRLRHPPAGSRGFAHRRWNAWGRDEGHAASSPPICLVQIESAAAVAAVHEIAAVEGVDGLVVGPADLALDLGVSPDLAGAELASAVTTVVAASASAGIAGGIAAGGDPRTLSTALAGGAQLLVYSADARLYASAIDKAADAARRALPPARAR